MSEKNIKEADPNVYEIGYLLVSSIPQEKVTEVANLLKEDLLKKGAIMISEEVPELRPLAYTMIKKIGSQNHRFDQGYFGWFKFELQKEEIEAIKKNFELRGEVLRMLVIKTVKENTYLGKKAPVMAVKGEEVAVTESPIATVTEPVTPASIEEMDKSIDDMVKEA